METRIVKIEPSALDAEIQKSGLEIQECEQIKQSYIPFLNDLANIQNMASEINAESPTESDESAAHDLRMKAVKIRTGAQKLKEERKRSYLLRGNLEQAAFNLIKASCEVTEDVLFNIEKAREIAEKKRKEQLRIERIAILSEYMENPDSFPLGEMSDQAWNDLLTGQKAAKQLKEEQAKKEEAERQAKIEAEKVEQERIRKENEKLQEEIRLKELEAEKIRKENESKLKKEREAAAEKLRIEKEKAAKEKAIADEKARKEREAREKAERDLKAAKDAEAKRLKDEQEAKDRAEKERIVQEKKAAKAPDKKKLQLAMAGFFAPVIDCKTPEGIEIAKQINAKFDGFKKWANEQIESL